MKHWLVFVMMVVGGVSTAVVAQSANEQVTALEDLRRGDFVTVTGTVTRLQDDDEFIIDDGTARAEIYVRGGLPGPAFRVGDTVTVRGRVDDDVIGLRREIYAREVETADGTLIRADGRRDE
jgi:uncharacterized protein YdeI (BOF family)